MRHLLLPLSLSAHPAIEVSRQDARRARRGKSMEHGSCRFCGLKARDWQEPDCLNGTLANARLPACVLCHLARHLDRPAIEAEALVIYLPEMSQAAVNAIARDIHLTFFQHGETLPVGHRSFADTKPELRAAYCAFKALEERSAVARARLGTASPRDLWAALMHLSLHPSLFKWDVGALRLLPLGRYYRGGNDIYPDLLEALSREVGDWVSEPA